MVDRIFQALADPTRRAIIEKLSRGPVSASRLAEPFEMSLAAVVQHLQTLEESGLVRSEKVGRVRTFQMEPGGLKVAEDWVARCRSTWETRLDRLAELLAEPDQS